MMLGPFILAILSLTSLYKPFFIVPTLIFLIWLVLKTKKRILVILVGISPLLPFFLTKLQTNTIHLSLVLEAKENYVIIQRGFERLYLHIKSHPYDVGDILSIEGERETLSFSMIEGQFDFQDYLNRKGVFYELDASHIEVKLKNPIRSKAYKNYVLSKFSESAKSLAGSILFSIDDDSSLLENYQSLHMLRLLSMSGIYMQLFMKFLKWLLNKKFKEKTSSGIALFILGIYLIIAFPRFAIIRVFLFQLFSHLNSFVFKKKKNYLSGISAIGLCLLLVDPFFALQDSFILGFIIPLFLYFLRPILKRFKNIEQKLITLLFLFIFFIPFELKYYQSISLLSPILQLILFPIFALFAISSLLVFYGLPLAFIPNFLAKPLSFLGSILSKINLEIYAPSLGPITTFCYYGALLLIIYLLIIKIGRYKYYVLGISFVSLLFYFIPIDHFLTDEISFINVGQGDATLIRKKSATFLVDTGGLTYLDVAKTSLIPYLKKKRIYHLDYVFITHHDFDHYGALSSLASNFAIKHIVDSDIFPLTYQGITFTNYNHYYDDNSDENDRSLVLGFHLLNEDYLLMGDASKTIEKQIMSSGAIIPCGVLKVGHHGSKTSTSEEFVSYLSPQKAIISCGKNNKFGHPHQEVLTILKKYHVKIYRTDYLGTINFQQFG